jgi:methanogenic corrinoid protein MtbC1
VSNPEDVDPDHAQLIALATVSDVGDLNAALEQVLARDGLRTFVLYTFAPLSVAVGELWAAGRLQVFEEHLITRHLVRFLDVATSRLGRPPGNPEVLLATFPGERHSLGLLMVEALLWRSGKATLNLGADVPMDQVVEAVCRSPVKTVALSFSACYPRGSIRAQLEELADRLPPEVTVWIGARVFGACPGFRRR